MNEVEELLINDETIIDCFKLLHRCPQEYGLDGKYSPKTCAMDESKLDSCIWCWKVALRRKKETEAKKLIKSTISNLNEDVHIEIQAGSIYKQIYPRINYYYVHNIIEDIVNKCKNVTVSELCSEYSEINELGADKLYHQMLIIPSSSFYRINRTHTGSSELNLTKVDLSKTSVLKLISHIRIMDTNRAIDYDHKIEKIESSIDELQAKGR